MPEQSGPESDLVINNVRLFDGLDVRDGLFSIGISGKTIDSVTTSAAKAKKEIDAAGRFLMPGLIDCYIHLNDFFHVTDEAAMAAYLDQELPEHLMELVSAGVTSIKSVGDPEDHILQTRDRLANGNLRGPRLFATGPCFTARESHPATTVYGRNPWYRQRAAVETDSPVEARDVVRRLAEYLGSDMLGMIAPGRFADLLLVDGDPTANISALRNVAMVMKNGEILIDKLSRN